MVVCCIIFIFFFLINFLIVFTNFIYSFASSYWRRNVWTFFKPFNATLILTTETSELSSISSKSLVFSSLDLLKVFTRSAITYSSSRILKTTSSLGMVRNSSTFIELERWRILSVLWSSLSIKSSVLSSNSILELERRILV